MRSLAKTALTCLGLSTRPVIRPFSAAPAGRAPQQTRNNPGTSGRVRLVIRSSSLVRGQKVHVNIQHQAGHRRRVNLTGRADQAHLGSPRGHVPAAILVLVLEEQLADTWVPRIPVLAARLVAGL